MSKKRRPGGIWSKCSFASFDWKVIFIFHDNANILSTLINFIFLPFDIYPYEIFHSTFLRHTVRIVWKKWTDITDNRCHSRVGCPNSAGKKSVSQWLTCNSVVPHRTELVFYYWIEQTCLHRTVFTWLGSDSSSFHNKPSNAWGSVFSNFFYVYNRAVGVILAAVSPVVGPNRIFFQREQDFTDRAV